MLQALLSTGVLNSETFFFDKILILKLYCSFWDVFTQDISEWEEDADEFIRKNLPSELVCQLNSLSLYTEYFHDYEYFYVRGHNYKLVIISF